MSTAYRAVTYVAGLPRFLQFLAEPTPGLGYVVTLNDAVTASHVAEIALRRDLGVVAKLSSALGLLCSGCVPVAERSPNWNGAPELT